MLRTNLATRPFYNERTVHVVIGLAALAVIGLTLLNFMWLADLSQRQSELSAQAGGDEARAQELNEAAARVRQGIDQQELQLIASAAREANAIIDRRTFSWTELFNRIETTLPADVMLTSIRPEIDKGVIQISMVVIGQRVEDIDAFMERLESTGAFTNILSRQEELTQQGAYRAVLQGRYSPSATVAPPPVAPTQEEPKGNE